MALIIGEPDPFYTWERASFEYDFTLSCSPRVLKYAHFHSIHADTAVRMAEIVFRGSGPGRYVDAEEVLFRNIENIRALELISAWDRSGFSIGGTAKLLGINRRTVNRQFKKLGFKNLRAGGYGSTGKL